MDTVLSKRKEILLYIAVFAMMVVMAPTSRYFESDMWCWHNWTRDLLQNGIAHGYDSGANYMPGFLYILWFIGWLIGDMNRFFQELYVFKGVILLFDFAIVLIFIFTTFKTRNRPAYFLAFFFNIAFLINTYLWGQVDSVYTLFALLAVFLAAKNKPISALCCYMLCINMKLQGIIFLPLVGLIYLYHFKKNTLIKNMLAVVAALAVQLIILLPFMLAGTTDKVWHTITHSVGYFPSISMNAFNMWMFLFPKIHHLKLMHVSNLDTFMGLSYKNWGLLLFCISSAIVLMPQFLGLFFTNFKKYFHAKNILLAFILLSLNFFYFNTEMHERYIHPAVVAGIAYCLYERKYLLLFLLSVAYTLNMEKCLHYLNLHNYETVIFNHLFIAGLWTIVVVWFYVLFFRMNRREARIL